MNLKLSAVAITLLASVSVFSQALPKGVVFQRDGAYLEYPSAFKILKPVTVKLAASPGPQEPRTISCQLPKDKRIILAKATYVVTQTSQTAKIQALQEMDFTYDVWEGEGANSKTVRLQAGEIVEDLSYYSEGNCLFKVRDQQGEGSCLGNSIDQTKMKQISELKLEASVKIISCINGTTGWLSESDMANNPSFESFMYNPY